MRLTKKQAWSVSRANKRLNIWEGAVRSGKSFASYYRFIKAVCETSSSLPPGTIDTMTGRTLASLKRNAIDPIIDLLGSNNARYEIGKQIFYIFDKKVHTFGANDERAASKIQGSTIRKSFGDELTLWPESFWRMHDTRLSLDESQFFGACNPDAPKHFLKTDYLDRWTELDLATFHFDLTDNLKPHGALTQAYIDNIIKNFGNTLWGLRLIKGLWAIAEGAIYDFFTEEENTILHCPIATSRVLSIDYGTTNPLAALLLGMNALASPKIWAEHEYYYDSRKEQRQKTDSEYADELIEFCSIHLGSNWRNRLTYTIIDPSAASFKVELSKRDFPGIMDADNSVSDGIRLKASMLKSRQYAIHVACRKYIEEFFNYRWNSKILTNDTPIKSNDHLQDAGRYAIQTLFGGKFVDYDILSLL